MSSFPRRALLLLAALLATAGPARADADLQVFKADALDPIPPGGTQTYTLSLTNSGPDDAELVTLDDTLPADTTFLSLSSPGGWSCSTPAVGSGGTVSCSTGLMAAFTSATFTLQVVFDSGLPDGTVVTNTATVSSETPEASPGDESGSASSTVGTPTDADLSIVKTGAPDPVLQGGDLTYTVTVDNQGPSDAAAATFEDTLPDGTTFQSLSSPGGWTCSTPAVGATGTVSCSIPTFPPGSAVFTLVVQVDASVPAGTVVSNTALVFSATADVHPENQSSSAFNTVAASATPAVTATKTVSGRLRPGGPAVYTIVLTNSGTGGQADNPGHELTDVLPSSLALAGASATSGAAVATVATNTVTWNGAIPAAGSVTITVEATIRPGVGSGAAVANQAAFAFDANGDGLNEAAGASDDPSTAAPGDATLFVVGFDAVEVPALDTVGLAALAALLAVGGILVLRRLA